MSAGPPPESSALQRSVTSAERENGGVTSARRSGSAAKCRLHGAEQSRGKLAPSEWTAWMRAELSAADRARSGSELVRANVLTACHSLCERTMRTQADATRRLGDRTNDIKFWRDELRAEADAAGAESAALDRAVGLLDRAFTEAQVPLDIAEECLHLREQRIGVDLVRDDVEIQLIKVAILRHACNSYYCSISYHNLKTMLASWKRSVRPSAWPLTFSAKYWHTSYLYPEKR